VVDTIYDHSASRKWFRQAIGGVAEAPTIDSREATAEDAQSDEEACAIE
jgi:hypothetical protein